MVSGLVGMLDALVAMPTIAGESNERLIDHVTGRLTRHGVPFTVIPSHARPDGLNLHAVVGPAHQPGGVVLSAHTDVVPVDGQPWSSDPFRLTRVGDRLHGRGTSDMKSFVAAAVCAAEVAAARPLRRPLHIALSCDEELGCAGVPSLLDALASIPAPPALCIVGEPTRMRVADRHKGKVRLAVQVRGRSVHSAAAPAGVNAVTYAARLVAALDDLARRLGDTGGDGAYGVPHATLSVGPIRGGVSTNIVPDECHFEFELRYLPGQDPAPMLAPARARAQDLEAEMRAVAPESAIELRELAAYPPLAPRAEPTAAGGPPLPGGTARRIGVDFGTEAGLYQERLGLPTLVCGPGDMARAHRADEYIEVGELESAQRYLDGIIGWLCTERAA